MGRTRRVWTLGLAAEIQRREVGAVMGAEGTSDCGGDQLGTTGSDTGSIASGGRTSGTARVVVAHTASVDVVRTRAKVPAAVTVILRQREPVEIGVCTGGALDRGSRDGSPSKQPSSSAQLAKRSSRFTAIAPRIAIDSVAGSPVTSESTGVTLPSDTA
ncbi:MAG: hypothetical protein ACI9MC_001849, partial [Kiritimatiellia bacterium]